jgi:hypothetical protein
MFVQVKNYQVVSDKRVDHFLNFGLCGDCSRTYRIKFGHTFLHSEVGHRRGGSA